MGITNFASYGDDTKPEYRCSFSVLQEYACVGDKLLLIHHSNLTC